jgi:pantothenate kinase
LVQDIFGSDKCGIIGLPPKLIASSLAKFAKEEKVSSTIWDQVQSVLVAFALNIGILAKEQIFLTKIPKVVFKTSEIASKQFLSVINVTMSYIFRLCFLHMEKLSS